MNLPPWIRSRWVVVPSAAASAVILWNFYVAAHNNGLVEGRVVDSAGSPVPGAAVLLYERGFVTHQERGRTTTDAAGVFRFTDNRSHSIQLEAISEALGRSQRRIVRLWFQGQDVRLEEPLRLEGASG